MISINFCCSENVFTDINTYDWEKFNETLLSEEEEFDGHLNMQDITAAGYTHPKKFEKILKYKI